jgi:hypothetical protein
MQQPLCDDPHAPGGKRQATLYQSLCETPPALASDLWRSGGVDGLDVRSEVPELLDGRGDVVAASQELPASQICLLGI